MCRNRQGPVFITKNGYGDMVIMSMKTYERNMLLNYVYHKLEEWKQSIRSGNVMDGFDSLKAIREKHDLHL